MSLQNVFRDSKHKDKNVEYKSQLNCPIIAATAYTDIETKNRAINAGIKMVLHKPIND